jgi:hypothetical protein
MKTNEISKVAWQDTELPGTPVGDDERWMDHHIALIRDGDGKPILFDRSKSEPLRDAFETQFYRTVKVVRLVPKDAFTNYVPGCKKFAPVVAFALPTGAPLSITQRIQAKTIADMFSNYMLVNPISESYRLPSVFRDFRRDIASDAWGIPLTLEGEGKAFQMALVAERILETEAEIVRDSDGSFFVVISHSDKMAQGDALLRLAYAIDLLGQFNITPSSGGGMITVDASEEGMFDRSLDGATTYEVQKRIENKLDAILSRLERPDEKGVGNTDTPVREKRLAKPADAAPKPGKSAASRRSA